MRTEDLIGRLATDLPPVRRAWRPGLVAALWLALVFAVLAAALGVVGIRPDLMARLAVPYDVAQFALVVTTGVLAAVAAAQLAQPDRSWRWALLPLPSLAGWLLVLGFGCLQEYWRQGPAAMHIHESWICVKFILGVGAPLAFIQYRMLRHAGPTRPLPVQLLGAVGTACLVSAALTLRHPLDTAVLILLWHSLAFALAALGGWALGHLPMLRPLRAS